MLGRYSGGCDAANSAFAQRARNRIQHGGYLAAVEGGDFRLCIVHNRGDEIVQTLHKCAAELAKDLIEQKGLRIRKFVFRTQLYRFTLAIKMQVPCRPDHLDKRIGDGGKRVGVNPPGLDGGESAAREL